MGDEEVQRVATPSEKAQPPPAGLSLETQPQEAGAGPGTPVGAGGPVSPDLATQRRIVQNGAKLEPLLRYISVFGCRRQLLLRHFGEWLRHCAGCDRCERRRARDLWEAA